MAVFAHFHTPSLEHFTSNTTFNSHGPLGLLQPPSLSLCSSASSLDHTSPISLSLSLSLSMSSSRRRFPVRHPVVVDIGCNCRRPRLPSLFSASRSKAKATLTNPFSSSPSITTFTSFTAPTFTATTMITSPYKDTPSPAKLSSAVESPAKSGRTRRRKKGSVARESVAVVKESSEPYADFRESMVQMIVEKEIYAWDDLNDLLHRFLSLNSPCHHHLILRAFADLWSGVFSPPSPSLPSNW